MKLKNKLMENTKQNLIDELDAMGIDFDDNASEEDLKALLNEVKEPSEDENKVEDEELDPDPTPAVPDEKKDTVEIDKIQLENIMERLSELEGKKTQKRVKFENRTCRIRLLNDKIVVGYGKSREVKHVSGDRILMLEVITEDGEKKEVEFVDFNETGEQLECEIIDTKKKEIEEELGYVFKTKVNWGEYRTEETDVRVPLVNKTMKIKYKLRLPDGKEIWMEEEAIN